MSGYAGFPYAGGAYAGASAASGSTDVGTDLPTVIVALDDGTGTFPYDITSFVEIGADGGPITQSYGREDEQGSVQASSVSLVLNNTDGRFTLGDTTIDSPSPIFVNNQIRLTYAVGATSSVRFTGFVQSWPVSWPGGGEAFSVVQVTAVDRLARLSRQTLKSITAETILLDNPAAYFPLGEAAGSTGAADASGNGNPTLTVSNSGSALTFGATGPLDGTAVTTGAFPAKYLHGSFERLSSPPAGMWLECAFKSATSLESGSLVDRGTYGFAPSIVFGEGFITGNVGAASVVSPDDYDDGQWHHALLNIIHSGAVGLYIDGVLVAGDVGPITIPTDAGNTLRVGAVAGVSIAHVAFGDTALSLARIEDHANAVLNGFAGESSDDRIGRYASFAGIDTSDMDLETGELTNVPHVDITGSTIFDAISNVAAAERGLVFIQGDGKLVFQNRSHRAQNVATDWTFTASPNLQGDLVITADMQRVFNHVTASRVDGPTQVAQDATSIATHGQYPASFDNLLVSTDAEALDLAQWVATAYSEPAARLPGATVDLMANTTSFKQAWLNREISDRITVTDLPAQVASTLDLAVEGWTETLSATEWTVTLNTSPWALEAAWILEDATYGVLDETTRLG